MQSLIFPVVNFLAVLTVVGQVLIIALVIVLFQRSTKAYAWVSKHALVLMTIVAVIAVSGSLFFSEVAGWTPCKDCWYQRIAMYPQVLLLLIALWMRDRSVATSIIVLCIIGAFLSADHYSEQVEALLNPTTNLAPCDTTGVSCSATQFLKFGYITIPMMALTAFFLNGLGAAFILRSPRP